MSSISNFPPLATLQGSLAQAVDALTPQATRLALEGVQQIQGFQEVSSLKGLISQGHLSRFILDPSLFEGVSRAVSGFGDLPGLKEALSLPSLEERLAVCAQVLDLHHGVQIFAAAEQRPGENEAKRLIDGALQTVGSNMSRLLRDELLWPDRLTLESAGPFAVSLRNAFDKHQDHLNSEQTFHLMRLASYVDASAPDICKPEPAEEGSAIQASKIATLIEILYGCGFGGDNELLASERLHRVSHFWKRIDVSAQEGSLRFAAATARDILGEFQLTEQFLKLTEPDSLQGAAATLREHVDTLQTA